jgi:fucose 4-O-acetylase-like acetyltransferase
MFLSGYLYSGKLDEPAFPWIFRKAVKLIPVYLLWHAIYALYRGDYRFILEPAEFWSAALLAPDSPWFLPILFYCLSTLMITAALARKLGTWVFPAYLGAAFFLPWPDSFGLVKVKWFTLFMVAGYLSPILFRSASRAFPTLSAYPKALDMTALALFPALFLFRLAWADIPPNIDFGQVNNWWRHPGAWWIQYALALSGILFSFALLRSLDFPKLMQWLASIGKYSLEIYLLNGLFLWIGFGTGAVRVASVTLISATVSLAIAFALRKIPYLNPFFFGANLKRRLRAKSPLEPRSKI